MKSHMLSAAGVTILLGAAWWGFQSQSDDVQPVSGDPTSAKAAPRTVVQPKLESKPVVKLDLAQKEIVPPAAKSDPIPAKSVVDYSAPVPIAPPAPVVIPPPPAPEKTVVAVAPVPLPEPDAKQQLWSDAEFNGFAALDLAQQTRGLERIGLIRHGIELISRTDPDTAVDVANALTEEHDHGVAVGTLVRVVAENDPKAAAKILFTRVPAETALGLLNYPRTAEAMRNVMATQIRQDPEVALAWVAQMSEGSSRSSAMENLAMAWGAEDPEAAAQWASSVSDVSRRENLLAKIRGESAPQTSEWLNSISDPSLRAKTREAMSDLKRPPEPAPAAAPSNGTP